LKEGALSSGVRDTLVINGLEGLRGRWTDIAEDVGCAIVELWKVENEHKEDTY
jgi:hypothetical protein